MERKCKRRNKFNYLRTMINTDGSIGEEVDHRVLKRRYVWEDDGKVVERE